ncbi:hypothetical protein B5M09_012044 [Aphanomyces astaci]|uniref:DDE-1 domain-containing protein n=1 Tax=Aphanomyces astaci TaxID=112090 RepID=A0A3R7Y8Z4_APHAT|nr:hypothetical protein B5M09_012044 [Aphanomyces astaci]
MRAQERALTTSHLFNWIKRHQAAWLRSYIARKKPGTGYQGLLRLLQRFCSRHGFRRQRPGKQKHKQSVLNEVRDDFAAEFHQQYHGFGPDCVYNVDVTGFYYDMPPKYIWSARGADAMISIGINVILLDKFQSHVNDASYQIVEEELGSFLSRFPPMLRPSWLTEEMIDGEDGDDFDTPTATEKRKSMVKRAIAAWGRVTATEIRNSFVKALPSIEE